MSRIRSAVVGCFAIAGLIILSYCIFGEREIPFLLPLGMLCVTISNLIQGVFTYKPKQQKWGTDKRV